MKEPVIQKHHLSYDPDVWDNLHQGEHWLLTQLSRRKKVSAWFIKCLKVWIILNEHNALNLSEKGDK